MSANEQFAVALWGILEQRTRKTLTTGRPEFPRPDPDALDELNAYASSGERALIALAWSAWRNDSGITSALSWADTELRALIVGALMDAYGALV